MRSVAWKMCSMVGAHLDRLLLRALARGNFAQSSETHQLEGAALSRLSVRLSALDRSLVTIDR